MGDFAELLQVLAWPTQAADAVRTLLAGFNVPLPAVLAQVLGLGVLLALLILFAVRSRRADSLRGRLLNGLVALSALVSAVAIVAVWIDWAMHPRSAQIIGHVASPRGGDFMIELMDFKGESLGAPVDTDYTGAFAISYQPAFADSPRELVVTAEGCQTRQVALRRSQLLGAEISILLRCGEPDA